MGARNSRRRGQPRRQQNCANEVRRRSCRGHEGLSVTEVGLTAPVVSMLLLFAGLVTRRGMKPCALVVRFVVPPVSKPGPSANSPFVSAIAIIPARYQSSRLPGKALADIGGRPMVCHVAERTRRARGLGRVIVATDDARIRDAVVPTGVEVAMTRPDHPTGTDRLAEVAARLDADVVVNVQGDLPFVEPAMVERLVARLDADPTLPMATLAAPVHDEAEWRSPHVVKVVAGLDGRALYFSRSPIPHDRDAARP